MTTDKLVLTAQRALAVFTDALVFASDDQLRPTMHAVQVVAYGGRCQVVGCDSYVLGTFTFAAEGTMEALVNVDDVKRIIAACKGVLKGVRHGSEAIEIVLERTDDTLEVRSYGSTISCRLVGGDYPNWRQLFDAAGTTSAGTFTAYALGKIAKVSCGFKTSKGDKGPAMLVELHGPKAAQLELEHDGIVFRGLAMPSTAAVRELTDVEVVETPSMVEVRLERQAALDALRAEDDDTVAV